MLPSTPSMRAVLAIVAGSLLAAGLGACDDEPTGTSTSNVPTAGSGGRGGAGSGNVWHPAGKGGTDGGVAHDGAAASPGDHTGDVSGPHHPEPFEPSYIGLECSSDAACGPGGVCLPPTGADIMGAGPAHGYCSVDCTAYLAELKSPSSPPLADPCGGGACVEFAGQNGPFGWCVQKCRWGWPSTDMDASSKCRGRDDVGCFPLYQPGDGGGPPKLLRELVAGQNIAIGWCRPACTDDASCPDGYECDLMSGGCTPQAKKCQRHETKCDPTSSVRQCEGDCVAAYGPNAPPSLQHVGVCMDRCVVGNPKSCDHLAEMGARCGAFDPFSVDGTEWLPRGASDQSYCAWPASAPDADGDCAWEAGSFVVTLDPWSPPVCLQAPPCENDGDCMAYCSTYDGCWGACRGGPCQAPDTSLQGGHARTCRLVPELNQKFCLDHTPPPLVSKPTTGCVP